MKPRLHWYLQKRRHVGQIASAAATGQHAVECWRYYWKKFYVFYPETNHKSRKRYPKRCGRVLCRYAHKVSLRCRFCILDVSVFFHFILFLIFYCFFVVVSVVALWKIPMGTRCKWMNERTCATLRLANVAEMAHYFLLRYNSGISRKIVSIAKNFFLSCTSFRASKITLLFVEHNIHVIPSQNLAILIFPPLSKGFHRKIALARSDFNWQLECWVRVFFRSGAAR